MKIEQVKIENFRSIYDLTVEFGKVTVLIGKNSSGKTSILNVIRIIFENLDTNSTEKNLNITTITEQNLKDQIRRLWFYTYQNYPIKLAVWLNFDEGEGDKLREVCGLESNVKKAYIEVSIESNNNQIIWKLQNVIIFGYVSETSKIAKEALKKMKEIHSKVTGHNIESKTGDSLVPCVIVESGTIKNKDVFNIFIDLIKNKICYVNTFPEIYKMVNIPIKGLFAHPMVSSELINVIKNTIKDFARLRMLYDCLREIKGSVDTYEQPDRTEILTKSYEGMSLNYELFGSGDQIIDGILASIISKGKHHIFLIEEPEIHLHPAYIRRLARVLEDLANNLNVQLIIVTHSPDFIATLKDKRFVIGVRKDSIKINFEGYPTELLATRIFYPFRGSRLSESLARDLGVVPGYFLFSDVAILVEGNSDRIILQGYIDLLIEQLKNLPKFSYIIIPYAQRSLKEMIKVFKEDYGIKVFLIADNDEEGLKNVKIAKDMGLRENFEVFIIEKKDILGYIKLKISFSHLMNY